MTEEKKRGRGRPLKVDTQSIEEKIELRLQSLEWMLCNNWHLSTPGAVQTVMAKLRPHYGMMTVTDQQYMDSAEIIIRDQIEYYDE